MGEIKTEVKHDESKDEKFKAFCATCKSETNHIVVRSVDVHGGEVVVYGPGPNERDFVDWFDRYQIIQCLGCDSYSFRHKSWFSEDQHYYGPDDCDDGMTILLFPSRGKDTLTPKDFYNVPKNLRAIYKEVVNSFNNDAPVLCAAGLRATIEGLCAAHGVTDGPVEVKNAVGTVESRRKSKLEGKINGLCEKGILTKQSADILHEHRYMGNDAVHELSRPSEEDLHAAIEIVEHTLESLYEIPEKAQTLRANRVNKKGA